MMFSERIQWLRFVHLHGLLTSISQPRRHRRQPEQPQNTGYGDMETATIFHWLLPKQTYLRRETYLSTRASSPIASESKSIQEYSCQDHDGMQWTTRQATLRSTKFNNIRMAIVWRQRNVSRYKLELRDLYTTPLPSPQPAFFHSLLETAAQMSLARVDRLFP